MFAALARQLNSFVLLGADSEGFHQHSTPVTLVLDTQLVISNPRNEVSTVGDNT